MRMGTISPPIKTSSAVVSLFLSLVERQCLTPGITFNVALIHPMESCVFCHRRDHSLISNGEERNSKTTSDPSCEMCCQNTGGMWMLKPQCVSTSLRLRLYSPGEWIHKAVSLRETQGDTDRYKEMKREIDTRRDRKRCIWRDGSLFSRPKKSYRNQTKESQKCVFNLTVSGRKDNRRWLKVARKPDLEALPSSAAAYNYTVMTRVLKAESQKAPATWCFQENSIFSYREGSCRVQALECHFLSSHTWKWHLLLSLRGHNRQ